MTQITTEIESITPAKAEKYLASMHENRPLKQAVVRRFIHALKAGHWQVTHQGLAFNGDGALLDGQHRLQAIVAAGVPAKMLVARGVSTNAFSVMDTGATRSPADFLALRGFKNPVVLATALRIQYASDLFDGDLARRPTPEHAADNEDLGVVADEHPRLVEVTQDPGSVAVQFHTRQARPVMPLAPMFFLYYRFELIDADLATLFFSSMLTGAGLDEASVILKTRERLLRLTNEITARRRGGGLAATNERMAMTIKAWNAVRRGEELSGRGLIMWRRAGSAAEAFPLIV